MRIMCIRFKVILEVLEQGEQGLGDADAAPSTLTAPHSGAEQRGQMASGIATGASGKPHGSQPGSFGSQPSAPSQAPSAPSQPVEQEALTRPAKPRKRRSAVVCIDKASPPPSSMEELQTLAMTLGDLPRVDWPSTDAILWSFDPAHSQDFSRAYTHTLRRFFAWKALLEIMVFKIGIAADPEDRYCDGYVHEQCWMFMDVVWQAPAHACRELEIALIASLGQIPGCQNVRSGGDGVHPSRDYTCYCYVVYAPAGNGVGLVAAHADRKQRRLE